MKRDLRYWRICVVLVVLLIIVAFTPLMLPHGIYKPMLMGLPYTLWSSMLITLALVVLTFIGSKVHPGSDEQEGEA
ncbi:MAG: hypothetical protein QNK35_02985 [Bacteroides sp.]|nr:hypothetical protein [Bacteroides sp.]